MELKLNPDDLTAFSKAIRQIATDIMDNKGAAEQNVQGVKFGQGAAQTSVPGVLLQEYNRSMTGIGENIQTLHDKLNLVADVADAIVKNYTDVTDLDALAWQELESILGITPDS